MLSIFKKPAKQCQPKYMANKSQVQLLSKEAISLLLVLEQRQERLEVRVMDGSYQTVMLGIDLTQGHLLLDGLFPRYPVIAGCRLTLKYALEDTLYIMETEVLEQWHHNQNTSMVVAIMDNYFSANRRLHDRIYFPQNARPQCRLHLPGTASVIGELADLSHGGMHTILFGKNRRLFKGTLISQCEVHFNEQFSIHCAATVSHHRYHRSPSCHNTIGLAFQGLEQENQQQIHSMIYAADTFLNHQYQRPA